METKFQTSFIPKKPLPSVGGVTPSVGLGSSSRPKTHGSLFLNLAILIFLISLGAAGGMYAWENISINNQNNLKQALADRQQQFDRKVITELKFANSQIDTAKRLLAKHVALSSLFSIISQFTLDNIRFLTLDINAPVETGKDLTITMSGQGANLFALAFQGKVLGSLEQYGLSRIIKNPIISNPSPDPANGSVTFGFSAAVDPQSLIYMKQSSSNSN